MKFSKKMFVKSTQDFDIWMEIQFKFLHFLFNTTYTFEPIIPFQLNLEFELDFHSNVKILGRFYKHFLTSIVQIDIVWFLFETRLETKIFANWTKATVLRIYFHNFSIGLGITQRLQYQARQPSWRDMCRGLIPGTIWKISCHNLFITYFTLTFSKQLAGSKSVLTELC
jgi:hypothetical protein